MGGGVGAVLQPLATSASRSRLWRRVSDGNRAELSWVGMAAILEAGANKAQRPDWLAGKA